MSNSRWWIVYVAAQEFGGCATKLASGVLVIEGITDVDDYVLLNDIAQLLNVDVVVIAPDS